MADDDRKLDDRTEAPGQAPGDDTPGEVIAVAEDDAAEVMDSDDLGPGFVRAIIDGLEEGRTEDVRAWIEPLHYAEVADLLERLSPDNRRGLLEILRDDFDSDILHELDETVREEVIDHLGPDGFAEALSEMDTDDAVYILEELDEEDQKAALESIPSEDRVLIEESLGYPEDSAGRMMQRELVFVPNQWTVGDTIDYMRRAADEFQDELPEAFYDVFVTDPAHRPVGTVQLARLIRSKRATPITDLMETSMRLIPVTMDQEEVAFIFSQRDLTSAPVVDEAGRLVGAITIDDVVDVINEEQEEDMFRMSGVSEGDFYDGVIDTTRSRFVWLLVNLGTAVLASLVISMFDATIEQIVALAVLMPIVASMGGNAGTQTLTIAVRAIATKELNPSNAMRILGKECAVGGLNGLLFAVLTGLVAGFWFSSPGIGVVIAAAMVVNLMVAGLAGAAIPMMLVRAGVDPAVASSVFLTTVTDVVGFFAFLGLAAIFLI